jgi:hypothetical protein
MDSENEKVGSGDSSANEAPPEANTASEPLSGAAIDQEPNPKVRTGDAGNSATETQKETLNAIKKGESIGLIIASVVAFGTLGQWITNSCNNSATSVQTDKLIAAANINALAAKKIAAASETNAKAAQDFAADAGLINKSIGDAVGQLQAQASQTSRSANIANETLRRSQRPWVNAESFTPTSVTLPPAGKFHVYGDLVMKNTGTSVATDGWVQMVATPNTGEFLVKNWDQPCKIVDQAMSGSRAAAAKGLGDTWPIGFVLAPNQQTRMRMGSGDANDMIEEKIRKAMLFATPDQDPKSGQFYLLGCARYKDQFGTPHTTRFCFVYLNDDMSPSGFYVCNGLETAD